MEDNSIRGVLNELYEIEMPDEEIDSIDNNSEVDSDMDEDDYELDSDVDEDDIPMRHTFFKFNGMVAEHIYKIIKDNTPYDHFTIADETGFDTVAGNGSTEEKFRWNLSKDISVPQFCIKIKGIYTNLLTNEYKISIDIISRTNPENHWIYNSQSEQFRFHRDIISVADTAVSNPRDTNSIIKVINAIDSLIEREWPDHNWINRMPVPIEPDILYTTFKSHYERFI
jgi:hypothetical protein